MTFQGAVDAIVQPESTRSLARWQPLVLLAAGALVPLALAPFSIWIFSLLGPAVAFVALRNEPLRRVLWLGWWFGVGRYAVGASWVYVSISVYGQAPWPLATLLVALFVAFVALFDVARFALWARFLNGGPVASACGFAALWIVTDWLLTWVLTGFPWLYPGHAHLATWLAGYAPVGSVLLVSGMAALIGALAGVVLLGVLDRARQTRTIGVALAGIAGVWVLGGLLGSVDWTQPGARHDVALIQGNIPQSTKWQPEQVLPILRTYAALSEPHWGRDLVIWPEAAITMPREMATNVLGELAQAAARGGGTLLVGIPDRTADGALLNSLRVVDETANRADSNGGAGPARHAYFKRKLVPFGDYVPFEFLRGLIAFFDLPMAHAVPGSGTRWLQAGTLRVAPAICYEIAYPEHVRLGGYDSDVLVTVSNDTWFGASHGPHQHFEIARMRALELGRFLLRSTNNGITAIVDSRGQVQSRMPQFEPGALVGEFRTMHGVTPYGRFGQWIPLGAAALLAALALLLMRVSRMKRATMDGG